MKKQTKSSISKRVGWYSLICATCLCSVRSCFSVCFFSPFKSFAFMVKLVNLEHNERQRSEN